ncbi:urease accessory protein UreD [Pelagicoccus sp. SDUM812003]|uniref:urease accessory protein UreD n=1 Tax=Pelagicoccus sp. SDUM812003 TaxID=3041267 RepID=UPI00280FC4A7|nr:urease accessory protein UreD [Pelagicoccus sp. SDUM812003]MDQ8201635.1 urease accessory protein UreD [Pelagicoccus sp. SDUM812003]
MQAASPTEQPKRQRVAGYLRLSVEAAPSQPHRFARKEFKSPIHISKPYWDGHSLLLNLMCPTAGMLGGDEVELDVRVDEGAALVLSNPSSLRIHKMDAQEGAQWQQRFRVGPRALLESNPEWLILQAESSFVQRTSIDLSTGAELFFVETIAPGRVAHGEQFGFRSFRNRLQLRYEGQLALDEKFHIRPSQQTDLGWIEPAHGKRPFYASLLLCSQTLQDDSPLWQRIYEMQDEQTLIGSSRLAHGPVWSVKLLSSSSPAIRARVESIRQLFYQQMGRPAQKLRRQ